VVGSTCSFLKPPQFKRAVAQRRTVPIQADRQFHRRLILRRDDGSERRVMFVAQFGSQQQIMGKKPKKLGIC
jgi:hypothetical protein